MINGILTTRTGHKCSIELDISMQHYTFKIKFESFNRCTIVITFWKYKYRRLPMGLKCSSGISQEAMTTILWGINECDVFIGNIKSFSTSLKHCTELLDRVLHRLLVSCFRVTPLKYEWAVQEMDWLYVLGFCLMGAAPSWWNCIIRFH